MTRQTSAPLKRVPMSSSKEPIVQLLRQCQNGSLDLNPPYQRGDVWTIDQRVNLIRSLLRGTAIPGTAQTAEDMTRAAHVAEKEKGQR